MPTDHAAQPWALRSTLVAVSDLDRSVDFYREVGPFEEIAREDAVAVLGEASPESIVLILRESRGVHLTRHGQQSLGLRSITFSVGSLDELDRIEAVLRSHDLLTSRQKIAEGASDLLLGRDPDNLPLVFVWYDEAKTFGSDYYKAIASLFYSLDI
jgi:catechol 2,3-dioxygenase-like lactoylglutathione lyase family enzyme